MNKAELSAEADVCVKCGMCLPHCPTYGQTRNENESPRGRIALIQAWADGNLEVSEPLLEHIGNCLLCRSCERVCPAQVRYGLLMDHFREQVYDRKAEPVSVSLLKTISHHPKLNRLSRTGLRFYQASGLQAAARRLKLPELLGMGQVDRLLTVRAGTGRLVQEETYFSARPECRGEVALFHGCMGPLLEQETIDSAVKVLNHIGYNVHIPTRQVCCGALDRHSGAGDDARELERLNVDVFSARPYDAIISLASGCGGQLKEYDTPGIAVKVFDICQFISATGINIRKQLAPLPETVCLHTPCSLRNIMHAETGAMALLGQLSEMKLVLLPETIRCCGSAGSYMLDHPEMAAALLKDLIAEAVSESPKYLLSSNIGCILHIGAGLRERGLEMEVLHPVTLIARQLTAYK